MSLVNSIKIRKEKEEKTMQLNITVYIAHGKEK